jgi:hypothetical protein
MGSSAGNYMIEERRQDQSFCFGGVQEKGLQTLKLSLIRVPMNIFSVPGKLLTVEERR